MSTALKQALEVVEALDSADREQLMRYFLNQSGEASQPNNSDSSGEPAKWSEFWRLGDELASQLGPGESPSKILSDMRR